MMGEELEQMRRPLTKVLEGIPFVLHLITSPFPSDTTSVHSNCEHMYRMRSVALLVEGKGEVLFSSNSSPRQGIKRTRYEYVNQT